MITLPPWAARASDLDSVAGLLLREAVVAARRGGGAGAGGVLAFDSQGYSIVEASHRWCEAYAPELEISNITFTLAFAFAFCI